MDTLVPLNSQVQKKEELETSEKDTVIKPVMIKKTNGIFNSFKIKIVEFIFLIFGFYKILPYSIEKICKIYKYHNGDLSFKQKILNFCFSIFTSYYLCYFSQKFNNQTIP